MIKIIICSNIRIYREGLASVLSRLDSMQVVGAENRFEDAIRKISQTCPDVVLLDMTMEGAFRAAREIIQCYPESKVVALSPPEDEKKVIECAEAGIAGYVAREASLDDLVAAVKGTTKGEIRYPPKIATYIFRQIRRLAQGTESRSRLAPESKHSDGLATDLTVRECQISRLIYEGLSNKQIARSLSIEVSTVKNHVHNILVKLDVKNRLQIISLLHQSAAGGGSRSSGLDHRLGIIT
jgi:two-component system nitrate/nitrite response regulator NarL